MQRPQTLLGTSGRSINPILPPSPPPMSDSLGETRAFRRHRRRFTPFTRCRPAGRSAVSATLRVVKSRLNDLLCPLDAANLIRVRTLLGPKFKFAINRVRSDFRALAGVREPDTTSATPADLSAFWNGSR